jgi:hypothetical protein
MKNFDEFINEGIFKKKYKKYSNRIEYQNDNGELHREDGPAVIWNNGSKSWYLNGKRHREDGPAIELSNGYKSWYLNDKQYTKEKWEEEVKNMLDKNPTLIDSMEENKWTKQFFDYFKNTDYNKLDDKDKDDIKDLFDVL